MKPLRVFLSYAREDNSAAEELYDRLLHAGFQPWLDSKDLLPGQDWRVEIERNIRKADCVIICLSGKSTEKRGYVQREIRTALEISDEIPEGKIFLIPLRLEPCTVPAVLSKFHWTDLFEPKGFDRLLLSLRNVAGIREGTAAFSLPSTVQVSIPDHVPEAEPYIMNMFKRYVWSGRVDYPLLSAFASVLRRTTQGSAIETLRGWIENAKTEAAEALGMDVGEMSSLQVDLEVPVDYLPIEESLFLLYKDAHEREDASAVATMAQARLALIAFVGEERQREWVVAWNSRLEKSRS